MTKSDDAAKRSDSTSYTPRHSFRAPDPEWDAFASAAKAQGRTASDVLRELMRNYVTVQNRKSKGVSK